MPHDLTASLPCSGSGEIYAVPAHLLGRFFPTEGDRDYDAPGAFGVESLLDVCHQAGLTTDLSDFVYRNRIEGTDEERAMRLVRKASGCDPLPSLTLVYLGELDRAGHRFGPGAPGLKRAVREADSRLERIVSAWQARGAGILVLGDHGMVEVEDTVDVQAEIHAVARTHGWRVGRDIFYFLDSTLCRFWFGNRVRAGDMEQAVRARLKQSDLATRLDVLEGDLARELGSPMGDRRYGDLVVAARKGVMIWPDFFNPAPVRGMHGYDPDHVEQQGFLLALGARFPTGTVEMGRLVDVAPTVAGWFDLRAPGSSEGSDLRAMARPLERAST